jgi:hypothetical protein
MIANFRTFVLAALTASGALVVATPAEAAFTMWWKYVYVNSQNECLSLLPNAAAAAGLRNVSVQTSGEVSGGAGALQPDNSSQVFSTMTCIPLDSGQALAIVMSTGLVESENLVIATRDSLAQYISDNSQ